MVIEKTVIVAIAIGGVSKVIAQVATDLPGGIDGWANLTAVGALIYVVVWIITKTLPRMMADFREESMKSREAFSLELKGIRDVFTCHQHPESPAAIERIEKRQILTLKQNDDIRSKVDEIHKETTGEALGTLGGRVRKIAGS